MQVDLLYANDLVPSDKAQKLTLADQTLQLSLTFRPAFLASKHPSIWFPFDLVNGGLAALA